MSDFNSDLTYDDVRILTEAVGHWETSDDDFLGFAEKLRTMGDPPTEVVEAIEEQHGQTGFFDWWANMKKDIFERERKAKDNKKQRMEEACFLKTKLIILGRKLHDVGMDELFHPDVSKTSPEQLETPPEQPGTPPEQLGTPPEQFEAPTPPSETPPPPNSE